jgi:hypothetical protein
MYSTWIIKAFYGGLCPGDSILLQWHLNTKRNDSDFKNYISDDTGLVVQERTGGNHLL